MQRENNFIAVNLYGTIEMIEIIRGTLNKIQDLLVFIEEPKMTYLLKYFIKGNLVKSQIRDFCNHSFNRKFTIY